MTIENVENWNRFCGVVVITSALHAEGREFDPRQNLSILFAYIFLYFAHKNGKLASSRTTFSLQSWPSG